MDYLLPMLFLSAILYGFNFGCPTLRCAKGLVMMLFQIHRPGGKKQQCMGFLFFSRACSWQTSILSCLWRDLAQETLPLTPSIHEPQPPALDENQKLQQVADCFAAVDTCLKKFEALIATSAEESFKAAALASAKAQCEALMSMPCSSSLALTQNFLPAGALTPEETPCRKNSVEDGGGELLESPAYSPSHLDGSPMDDLDGEPVEKKAMDDILTACTPDTKHRVVVEGEALVVHERGEGHMPCEPDEAPALPSPDPETTQRAKRTRKSAPLALDSMPGVPVPSQPTGRSATKKRKLKEEDPAPKTTKAKAKGRAEAKAKASPTKKAPKAKAKAKALGKKPAAAAKPKGKKPKEPKSAEDPETVIEAKLHSATWLQHQLACGISKSCFRNYIAFFSVSGADQQCLFQLSNIMLNSATNFSTQLCLVSTQVYSTAWKKAKTDGKVGKERRAFALEARKKSPGLYLYLWIPCHLFFESTGLPHGSKTWKNDFLWHLRFVVEHGPRDSACVQKHLRSYGMSSEAWFPVKFQKLGCVIVHQP